MIHRPLAKIESTRCPMTNRLKLALSQHLLFWFQIWHQELFW